jgi:hypothetical protein
MHMYVLTGAVIVDVKGDPDSDLTWTRETGHIHIQVPEIPRGTPQMALELVNWAPFVTINAIGNDSRSYYNGAAVDSFNVDLPMLPSPRMILEFVPVKCLVAARDRDGYVYRIGYHITLTGRFVEFSADL